MSAAPPPFDGFEARGTQQDHLATRLWLRMLTCSTQIEQIIRERLRKEFGTTLARFDFLAQLDRHPEGLKMNALSRYLMVTGGNVTGLTDQLVAEGWVMRGADPTDRRSCLLSLTEEGRQQFKRMAAEHERWLMGLFNGLDHQTQEQLYQLLGALRMHLGQLPGTGSAAAAKTSISTEATPT